MSEISRAIETLIAEVRRHSSSFYRDHWKGEHVFEKLPLMNRNRFADVPLSERTYIEEGGLVKIVKNEERPFLVQWGLSALGREHYGTTCERPFVLLSDSHEAVEKSLWFYEHDILPLIGEHNNFPIAAFAAKRYSIDSIVSDEVLILKFLSELQKEYSLSSIISLTLIGSSFSLLPSAFPFSPSTLRYVAALPETGAFAESCSEALNRDALMFHADSNSVCEIIEGILVVTKMLPLVTPVIRFSTGIPAQRGPECACGKKSILLS